MYLMREAILRSIEAIRGTAASEAPMYLMREAITHQEAIKRRSIDLLSSSGIIKVSSRCHQGVIKGSSSSMYLLSSSGPLTVKKGNLASAASAAASSVFPQPEGP